VAEYGVFPRIVRAFKSQWPKVHLIFHCHRTSQQFEALSRDELDVGFLCPPLPTNNLDLRELTQQPFVAVVSEDHRLAEAPGPLLRRRAHRVTYLIKNPITKISDRQICDRRRLTGPVPIGYVVGRDVGADRPQAWREPHNSDTSDINSGGRMGGTLTSRFADEGSEHCCARCATAPQSNTGLCYAWASFTNSPRRGEHPMPFIRSGRPT
jgi:hypothetical protein